MYLPLIVAIIGATIPVLNVVAWRHTTIFHHKYAYERMGIALY